MRTTAVSCGWRPLTTRSCRRTWSSYASMPDRASKARPCARPRADCFGSTSNGVATANPFERFATRLERDLPGLLEGDAARYHAYAFATVRMAGSAFELAGVAPGLAARGSGSRGRRASPRDRGRLQAALAQARASPSLRCPAGRRADGPRLGAGDGSAADRHRLKMPRAHRRERVRVQATGALTAAGLDRSSRHACPAPRPAP